MPDTVMYASARAYQEIKKHEGCNLRSYLCPAGKWTVGYGHTGKEIGHGQTITLEHAEELLMLDVSRFETAINLAVEVPLTQYQFDALLVLAFNIGVGAFSGSTLRRRLNEGKYKEAGPEFEKWVYGGGKVLPGLVARRKRERALFEGEETA